MYQLETKMQIVNTSSFDPYTCNVELDKQSAALSNYLNITKYAAFSSIENYFVRNECQLDSTLQYHKDFQSLLEDYQKADSHSSEFGVDIPLLEEKYFYDITAQIGFANSHSSEAFYFEKSMKNFNSQIIHQKFICKVAEASLKSNPKIASDLQETVEKLPILFSESNYTAFKAFFDKWGDHYFSGVDLGGEYEFYSSFSECEFAGTQIDIVKTAQCFSAEIGIPGLFKVGSSDCTKENLKLNGKNYNSLFSKNSFTKIRGGDPIDYFQNYLNNRTSLPLSAWLATIWKAPSSIGRNFKLQRISTLFPSHQIAMDEALEYYYRNESEEYFVSKSYNYNTCLQPQLFTCPNSGAMKDCQCVCQNDDCCGKGNKYRLRIHIQRAGSWSCGTDPDDDLSVIVRIAETSKSTRRIDNDGNPHYDETLDFGFFSMLPLRIEIKVEDYDLISSNDYWTTNLDFSKLYVDGRTNSAYFSNCAGTSYVLFDISICDDGWIGSDCQNFDFETWKKKIVKGSDNPNGYKQIAHAPQMELTMISVLAAIGWIFMSLF